MKPEQLYIICPPSKFIYITPVLKSTLVPRTPIIHTNTHINQQWLYIKQIYQLGITLPDITLAENNVAYHIAALHFKLKLQAWYSITRRVGRITRHVNKFNIRGHFSRLYNYRQPLFYIRRQSNLISAHGRLQKLYFVWLILNETNLMSTPTPTFDEQTLFDPDHPINIPIQRLSLPC